MEKMLALGVVLSATDMLSPSLGKATKNLNKFEGRVKALGASITKLGTVSLALGASIVAPLGAALNSYQDIAKAQGEIASLGIGDNGINAITKSAMEFSNQFAGTTAPQFIKASYDIKSGIASLSDTAVGEFTKIAAITGSATKSSTELMTSLFASGYGIYRKQFSEFGASTIQGWNKLSDEEKDIKFGEYFSAGIASSVQAFKTDGQNMSAALSSLGASATSSGIGFAEQLSILGQLQATMSGSEAATKYRAFLSSAGAAAEKLDLSFTDVNNNMLSMPDIINRIKDKYGETIDAVEAQELKKAFGTEEAVALVKLLYNETDTLTDNINGMSQSLQNGTKKTKEMALAMNKGKGFDILGQKIGNLSALIGQSFAPIALKVGNIIGDVVTKIQTWTTANPELTSTITTVLAVAGGVLTVFGSIAIAVGATTMALPALASAFSLVTGAAGMLGTVMTFVGRVFLMNPIGLAVTAIGAAAYIIYRNWGSIKGFFIDMWNGIKSIFTSTIDIIKTYLGWTPLGMILNNWGFITSFFGDLWGGVVNIFSNTWTNIKSSFNGIVDYIKSPFEAFFNWIASKFEWITNTIGSVVDTISSIGNGISDTVSGVGDKIGSGLKTASNFFKFGNDEDKTETENSALKPSNNTKYKMGDTVKKVVAATAVTTQLAAAQPSINYATPNIKSPASKQVQQNNNIKVVVQNPSSNVDVEKAIVAAMKNSGADRSLSDEDI
jgi:TP901 family phage tail tape measure protein